MNPAFISPGFVELCGVAVDTLPLPPAPPAPASPSPPSNEFSFGKLKRNKKKGTAKLPVIVPGPGMGRMADGIQRFVPARLPIHHEGPWTMVNMRPFDASATVRDLGVEFRPARETLTETVRWVRNGAEGLGQRQRPPSTGRSGNPGTT